jgi:mannose-6-phosphate isomerase-like protein (cupin superfamily)
VNYYNEYKPGQQDQRPWGDWAVLDTGPGYCAKRIRVAPGGVLSLQRHAHRAERWIVVRGTIRVTRNDEQFDLSSAQTVDIAQGDWHRMANQTADEAVVIEVQTGLRLQETDIERIEDIYGRV